jgi:hypothetical protein
MAADAASTHKKRPRPSQKYNAKPIATILS